MAEEIGYILFVQLLGMTQYPGSPFTGNIMRDLIMFFIVPSIFIILVVYMAVGRILIDQPRLRIMLGLGMYLFIIAGGYYPAFALLAGPYFVFLIFIIGLLYFLLGHFGIRGRGGTYRPHRGGGTYRSEAGSGSDHFEGMTWFELNEDEERVKEEIRIYNQEITRAEKNHDPRVESLRMKLADKQSELFHIKRQKSLAHRLKKAA